MSDTAYITDSSTSDLSLAPPNQDIFKTLEADFKTAKTADSTDHMSLSNSEKIHDGDGASAANKDLFFRFIDLDLKTFTSNPGYELRIEDVRTGTTIANYSFPINPSSINVSVPTAETLEATMKGVYGTQNGAPFRPIAISGTTGVNPITTENVRKNAPSELKKVAEYAFRNTIQNVNNTLNQFNKTLNAFSGGSQKMEGPLNYKSSEIIEHITGFESIHDLDRFLDFYTASKRLSKNRGWRLYFLMHKDQKYYACSLQNWAINKQAGTIEYNYSINLIAYKRVPSLQAINVKTAITSAVNAKNSANILSDILNGLRRARATVAAANGIMSGIRSDIKESFIQPIGEAILLAKDLVGTAKSMSDFAFSGQTVKAMEAGFTQYFSDNRYKMQDVSSLITARIGQPSGGANAPSSGSYLMSSAQDKRNTNKAEQFQQSSDSADPIGILFQNPSDYPEIFDSFPIDDMNLPVTITDQLDSITNKVLQFRAIDMIERRDKIIDFSRSISEALGGGSASYNTFKGLNNIKKTFKKLTVDDIVLLNQLNDIAINMDSFIALLDQSDANNRDDYYKFYADYATTQGIQFNTNNLSKFFIPFPMGGSLQQLAVQYLGSADRWIEIAALNALKSPYIDEDGYFMPVTASSGGNTLTITNPESLWIGEIVHVSANSQRTIKCKVLSIDVVSEIQTIVTLDPGNATLTSYKPSNNAKIQAFMPNTVNSDMLIAIPSANSPTFDTTFKTSPEVADLNGLARLAKIDLLLDTDGDIVFTGGGEVKLAYGLTNLVQAAVIKLRTKTQQLMNIPNFGNPVDAGISSADVTGKQILDAISGSFKTDPRFGGILAGSVQMSGPTVTVSILIGIQNTQVSLPVSAELPR